MAELRNIFLRTGCFCNPGACQRHLKLSNTELIDHFKVSSRKKKLSFPKNQNYAYVDLTVYFEALLVLFLYITIHT